MKARKGKRKGYKKETKMLWKIEVKREKGIENQRFNIKYRKEK